MPFANHSNRPIAKSRLSQSANSLRKVILAFTGLACCLLTSEALGEEPWRTIHPDIVYGHKAGMALTYDVVQPTSDSNGAAVAFMVSGGWISQYVKPDGLIRESVKGRPNLFEQLVKKGYTVYLVRHGSSPFFKVPDAVEDVRKAVAHIRSNAEVFSVDDSRLGVFGMSAGGHLSLMLGTTGDQADESYRVAAVAAYFPPTSLDGIVGPDKDIAKQFPALAFSPSKSKDVSPLEWVSSDDAPSLMIHGTEDRLVPIWHSEKIKTAFETAGVPNELIVIEGARHGFRGEDAILAETAVLEWFEEHLNKE